MICWNWKKLFVIAKLEVSRFSQAAKIRVIYRSLFFIRHFSSCFSLTLRDVRDVASLRLRPRKLRNSDVCEGEKTRTTKTFGDGRIEGIGKTRFLRVSATHTRWGISSNSEKQRCVLARRKDLGAVEPVSLVNRFSIIRILCSLYTIHLVLSIADEMYQNSLVLSLGYSWI